MQQFNGTRIARSAQTGKPMVHSYYALIADPLAAKLTIRIYPNAMLAEDAREKMSPGAQIIRFKSEDLFLDNSYCYPIYLALTLEDDGLRIHAATSTLADLLIYKQHHCSESPIHSAIAWSSSLSVLAVTMVAPFPTALSA